MPALFLWPTLDVSPPSRSLPSRYLKEEGFYTSSYGITGYYGPVTKQAVTKWQVRPPLFEFFSAHARGRLTPPPHSLCVSSPAQKANGVLATGNFGGMSRAKYLDLQVSRP